MFCFNGYSKQALKLMHTFKLKSRRKKSNINEQIKYKCRRLKI